MENTMIRIKVQYDPLRRTFKLVDHEFNTILEGDALYDLNLPFMYEETDMEELMAFAASSIAHT